MSRNNMIQYYKMPPKQQQKVLFLAGIPFNRPCPAKHLFHPLKKACVPCNGKTRMLNPYTGDCDTKKYFNENYSKMYSEYVNKYLHDGGSHKRKASAIVAASPRKSQKIPPAKLPAKSGHRRTK